MGMNDKPTDKQIQVLYRWFHWNLPRDKACHALDWLQEHATRGEVSQEIDRVHDLYEKHSLSPERCFSSPIWDGYKQIFEGDK